MAGMKPFDQDELAMVRAAFAGPYRQRNLSMFEMMLQTGFRISELLSLAVSSVLDEDGEVRDRVTVRKSRMKGNWQSRTVLLNDACRDAIERHIADIEKRVPLLKDAPLFAGAGGRRLSRKRAWEVFSRAYRSAGLGLGHGTHGLRKTFAGRIHAYFLREVREGGRPLDVLRGCQKALGHSKIDSTIQYLEFLDSDVDDAVNAIGMAAGRAGTDDVDGREDGHAEHAARPSSP